MSSKRLARQIYTKEWKRARREVLNVRALVRAQLDAGDAANRAEESARDAASREEQAARDAARTGQALQEAEQQHNGPQHMPEIQPAEIEEQPEFMAEPTSSVSSSEQDSSSPSTHVSPAPSRRTLEESYIEEQTSSDPVEGMTHGEEEGASGMAAVIRLLEERKRLLLRTTDDTKRTMEEHMGLMTRRIEAMERRMEAMERRMEGMERKSETLEAAVVSNPPQPPLQEDVLLGLCSTVEELDRSLAQPERRNQMKRFLESLGGANPGAAIRHILRQVATNNVLAQYSLRGRRAKKPFQNLTLCKIITEACMQNFPGKKVADIEECTGHALKFAPHRRSAGPQD
ncbi:uncharacterized protein LOC132899885 [Neoarius graeffei]|uniref:uncharacterized protein LOC132899885 n=1 Tax=Neoarius graeffei TaxID=443677 RepID=UPI00298CDF14|nr:uncharacterized protein LOC132899885 [Neoarius graeffei]XP_060797922.1 uncharacterized protein LOC132899885 [Neoarius graeffei]